MDSSASPLLAWDRCNPVYQRAGWSVKDACWHFHQGQVYLFYSAFFQDARRFCSHVVGVKSHDLCTFSEPFLYLDGHDDGWTGMCSPNLSWAGGRFFLTFNSWGDRHPNGRTNQLFYCESRDLEHWSRPRPVASSLTAGQRCIDLAVAFEADRWVAFWKQNVRMGTTVKQLTRVAAAPTIGGDYTFLDDGFVTFVMADGTERPLKHENYQFLCIDERWHLLTTDYPPHSPVLYQMQTAGDWRHWVEGRELVIPRQHFNTAHHANAAYLADWRTTDGYFYLLYAGNTQTKSHHGRGDNRLGVARSRDLTAWEPLPPCPVKKRLFGSPKFLSHG
jgi:hypothetical protein